MANKYLKLPLCAETSYGRSWGDPYNISIPLNCDTITITTQDRYGNKGETVVFTLPEK